MSLERFTDPSNYGARKPNVKFIIMHGSGKYPTATWSDELAYLLRPGIGVSYDYYITKDGQAFKLVPDAHMAWHAGSSAWVGYKGLNQWSLGVCFESSNGIAEVYPDVQRDAAERLVRQLMHEFNVPAGNVLSHKEISVPIGRKVDPVNFDMYAFRELLANPPVERVPAYHPVTNQPLGDVTIIRNDAGDILKVYPAWLQD